MRWIWIDRFTEFESGKSATAVKVLSQAEDHFAQHFPGFPVMPATLILEGLAQTGGILVGEANQFREKVVLAKIPKAKFHRDALAGEMLTYHAAIVDLRPQGAVIAGKVHSGTELIAEAEIFFAHLDQSMSRQVFGDQNFVFSGELKYLLGAAQQAAAAHEPPQLPPASA
ncbi:MAG: beta-hydroxyacyl-ACP dehydratase [Bacteroidales bacterium]|nr:beta-hydroxyacyl-ACP dehydratase [Bacteroidales bacterium]